MDEWRSCNGAQNTYMVISLNYCSQNGGSLYRAPYYIRNLNIGPRVNSNLGQSPHPHEKEAKGHLRFQVTVITILTVTVTTIIVVVCCSHSYGYCYYYSYCCLLLPFLWLLLLLFLLLLWLLLVLLILNTHRLRPSSLVPDGRDPSEILHQLRDLLGEKKQSILLALYEL